MRTVRPFGFLKTAAAMVMFLALWMPCSLFAQHVTGSGTSVDPYVLTDSIGFMSFHNCMTPGNKFYLHDGLFVANKVSSSDPEISEGAVGKYFKLGCDVILNRGDVAGCNGEKEDGWIEWRPMDQFGGSFDGDGHVVSGLYTVAFNSHAPVIAKDHILWNRKLRVLLLII